MKPTLPILLFAVAGLAGCATPFRAPTDVAHIQLVRGDSPVVHVEKIWLERKQNTPLVLKGFVVKNLGVEDTTGTHLDVSLQDAAGRLLRTSVEYFEPRQIPRRHPMPDWAEYRVVLDPLPPGTVKISVQAHERPHP